MNEISTKEHRALAEFAKPPGTRDWSGIHANSIHALERKGYLGDGRRLTPTGKAALAAVPNIFDDLFERKEGASMPKKPIVKKPAGKPPEEFRSIEFVEMVLYEPVRERWPEGTLREGVRVYSTARALTHGEGNARWDLQVRAWAKTKKGKGKHFVVGSASMSREDLMWLRDLINTELLEMRRKP